MIHTSTEEDFLYNTSSFWLSLEDRSTITFPEDKPLYNDMIWSVYKGDEEMREDEIERAWTIFGREEELKEEGWQNLNFSNIRILIPSF